MQDDNIHMTHAEHDDDPAASPVSSSSAVSSLSSSDSDMDTTVDATGPAPAAIASSTAATTSQQPSLKPTGRPASSPSRAAARAAAAATTGATATNASAVHQSAKMMDAQGYFQRVVKQELQVLLASGVEREVAVKKLLHRIVECTEEPEPSDVRRVMKQFQMNYDDAVRALIVKQEIGRLKRQGMDAFAAIEELTRKMQRVIVVAKDEEKRGEQESEQVAPLRLKKRSSREMRGEDSANVSAEDKTEHECMRDADGDSATQEADEHEGEATLHATASQESDGTATATAGKPASNRAAGGDSQAGEGGKAEQMAVLDDGTAIPCDGAVAAAAAVETEEELAVADEDADRNLSSLSLCQRIGNVTISSDSVDVNDKSADASTSTAESASSLNAENSSSSSNIPGLQSPKSSCSPTSSSSSPPLFSRKRRNAFGPFAGIDGKDASHRQSSGSSGASFRGGGEKEHSGPSTLPLFPSSKKQKLMVEVGDSFLTMVSRKNKAASKAQSGSTSPTGSASPPPSSPPSSSSSSKKKKNSSSSSHDHPTVFSVNPHKRQRDGSHSPGFDKFPVLDDELSTAAHMIRLTKRHKHQSVAAEQRSSSPTDKNH